jgi:hypothetical protein
VVEALTLTPRVRTRSVGGRVNLAYHLPHPNQPRSARGTEALQDLRSSEFRMALEDATDADPKRRPAIKWPTHPLVQGTAQSGGPAHTLQHHLRAPNAQGVLERTACSHLLGAKSLGTVVGFLDQRRFPQRTDAPLPRAGAQLQPKLPPAGLFDFRRRLRPLGDQFPFLLGQTRIDVKRELITVSTELSHHEMHVVLQERRDEVHVARQTIQTRDDQRTVSGSSLFQSRRERRPQGEWIPAGAGLNILIPRLDGEAFARGEGLDVKTLCRESQPAAALLPRADS